MRKLGPSSSFLATLFFGVHGQEVELALRGYAHAFTYPGDEDANWLRVFLRVYSDLGTWQVEDPCLLTWERAASSEWLEQWSRNEPDSPNPLDFMEPNLCFERRTHPGGSSMLRIGFDLECRPPRAVDEVDYYVDCAVDSDTLQQLVEDLRQEQRAFPAR